MEQFPITLKVKRLTGDVPLPSYESAFASGMDLYAEEDVIIEPGQTVLVRTGIAIQLPNHHEQDGGVLYEAQIRPRSGITHNTKLRVGNSPGSIDNDFRGELKIIMDNIAYPSLYINPLTQFIEPMKMDYLRDIKGNLVKVDKLYPVGTYIIKKGQRIAQLVIAIVIQTNIKEVYKLDGTARGEGGFGHTGV